ncbi:HNH endonuclease [Azospirillum argentinense]|uniref:HNH endonuclease n=1 Tax=Azospirillum argentinense TaxID=2970906 RepID=UPI003D7F7C39
MPARPPVFRPQGWKPAPRAPKSREVQDPYYGSVAWRDLREACWSRDGYRCTDPRCRTPNRGHGGKLIAHHIKERRQGGADALWNLATLCPTCHERAHRRARVGHQG